MPKKRPIQRNWSSILWMLLVANVIVGSLFSKITAPVSIRAIGAREEDHARIMLLAQSLSGSPWSSSDAVRAASKVMELGAVSSAEFQLNVFGRGVLRIKSRSPVARIKREKALALAEDGVVFSTRLDLQSLPQVSVPSEFLRPNSALCALPPAGRVAFLCRELSTSLETSVFNVEVDGLGMIKLRAEKLAEVVMGSCDDLLTKLEVLKRIAKDQPQVLETSQTINLTSPDNPMIVRRP